MTRNMLKIIACLSMIIDHIGEVFIPQNTQLYNLSQFIGYIAAPIFFYFIVEGYHHTRSKNKYTLNLFLFFLISYLPFILYFYGFLIRDHGESNVFQFNIFFTLLVGLLILRVRHEINNKFIKYLLIFLLFCASNAGDWGFYCPLIILVFDVMRGDKGKQLFTYSIIVLMKEYTITSFFIPLMNYFDGGNLLHFPLNIGMWISEFYWYPLGMLLPIPLLALYNGENGKKSNFIKYGFYAFYPAHLILLYIIKILV